MGLGRAGMMIVLAAAAALLGCGSSARTRPRPADVPAPAPAAPPAGSDVAQPTAEEEGLWTAAQVEEARATIAALPHRWQVRYRTKLVKDGPAAAPADVPPPDGPFALVTYVAEPGPLVAYVTKDPGDGKRHPAIVWIAGGDTNSIGDMWHPATPDNDQTAAAYRRAGLVLMVPSLRGGNDNPGRREGFLGETDDVVSAYRYLESLPYVDPDRIYLGGHSTGGTLALLTAEQRDPFRAVFSFGPVGHAGMYGGQFVYCDPEDEEEMALRSPMFWLKDVRTPTFVFEGGDGESNARSLRIMQQLNPNPLVRFFLVEGADHFGVLAPTNALIAAKLAADVGPDVAITFDAAELARPFAR